MRRRDEKSRKEFEGLEAELKDARARLSADAQRLEELEP